MVKQKEQEQAEVGTDRQGKKQDDDDACVHRETQAAYRGSASDLSSQGCTPGQHLVLCQHTSGSPV